MRVMASPDRYPFEGPSDGQRLEVEHASGTQATGSVEGFPATT